MQKRLYRSRRDHIIAGIAGGLGEYFDIDPTIVRLVMLLLVFPGGAGFLMYIMAWVIIPPAPGHDEDETMFARSEKLRRRVLLGAKRVEARLQGRKDGADATAGQSEDNPSAPPSEAPAAAETPVEPVEEEAVGGPPDTSEEEEKARRQRLGGVMLIGVGILFVLRNFFPWVNFGDMWPAFIIGLGVLLILRGLSE